MISTKPNLTKKLKKLKVEWAQEHQKTNEQHNAQISQVLKEVEALKEQSRSQPKAESNKPGDKISGLRATAFNFMPRNGKTLEEVVLLTSTMTLSCGVKMMTHHQFHHANRMKNMSISQVHCAIQYNLTSSILMMKIPSLVIQAIRSSVILAIPFVQQPVRSQIPAQTTVDTDATTIIGKHHVCRSIRIKKK